MDPIRPSLGSQIGKVSEPNATVPLKPNDGLKKPDSKAVPFHDLLNERLDQSSESTKELKFSAHAKTRLASRGIELTPQEIVKMQEAIQKASAKGSKESLVLTDKAAFVVSVKNNTVITAVDRDSLKENLFTNIDSTIMI